MALILEVKSDDVAVSRIRLSAGRNKINVRPGDTYRIIDDQTGFAPPGTTVKRVDSGILIEGLGRGETAEDVVVDLTDFYSTCSVSSPCSVVIQKDAAGVAATVTPETQPIGALSDGAFVLYDPAWAAPEAIATPGADTGVSKALLYGLGGLAIVGLAVGGASGGGGDGGGASTGGTAPDGTLKLTSSSFVNLRKPLITGFGEAGATVNLQLDLNRDNVSDVRYQTTVGSDGRWSIDLASATPTTGSLPAAGISDNSTLLISSTTNGAPSSIAPINLVFDNTPPAPAVIASVATDNAVNSAEKQGGVVVSGTAEANGSILLSWGGVQKPVPVDAGGNWTASFAAAEVPADGATQLSAIARDAAGNAAAATSRAITIETVAPALSVAPVTGDNRINVAEAGNVTVSGTTAPSATIAATWGSASKPATAAANGTWSVNFVGAEVPAPADIAGANINLVVTSTTALGNAASVTTPVLVDRTPPVAPGISPVEGDNSVTLAERADGVVISGTGETGTTVSLNWGGAAKTGAVANGAWSIPFAVGEVPVAAAGGTVTTVTANATDIAGNAGPVATLNVTVQQPFPAPTIANVAGDNTINATELAAGVQITGTVAAGAPGVNVSLPGVAASAAVVTGTTWTFTVPANAPLTQGAGNVVAAIAELGGQAATRPITVDTIGPVAPTIAPIPTANNDGVVNIAESAAVVVSGTTEANGSVRLAFGAAPLQTANANAAGAWTFTYGTGTLPAVGTPPTGVGSAVLTVTPVDSVGNAGTPQAATVQFDRLAPVAPTINPATVVGSTVLLSGITEAGSSVKVAFGAGPGQSADAIVTGTTWSASLNTGLTSGIVNVTATATDAAKNAGPASTQLVTLSPPVADSAAHDILKAQTEREDGQAESAAAGSTITLDQLAVQSPVEATEMQSLTILPGDARSAVGDTRGEAPDGTASAYAAVIDSLLWQPPTTQFA